MNYYKLVGYVRGKDKKITAYKLVDTQNFNNSNIITELSTEEVYNKTLNSEIYIQNYTPYTLTHQLKHQDMVYTKATEKHLNKIIQRLLKARSMRQLVLENFDTTEALGTMMSIYNNENARANLDTSKLLYCMYILKYIDNYIYSYKGLHSIIKNFEFRLGGKIKINKTLDCGSLTTKAEEKIYTHRLNIDACIELSMASKPVYTINLAKIPIMNFYSGSMFEDSKAYKSYLAEVNNKELFSEYYYKQLDNFISTLKHLSNPVNSFNKQLKLIKFITDDCKPAWSANTTLKEVTDYLSRYYDISESDKLRLRDYFTTKACQTKMVYKTGRKKLNAL